MGIFDIARREAEKRGTRRKRSPVTKLHPFTEELTEAIRSWRWPKGAGKTAEAAVDASLWAYEDWDSRLKRASIKNRRLERFRDHVWKSTPNLKGMIICHFDTVLQTESRRARFTGNLRNHIWRPDYPWWKAYGAEMAEAWCGEPELWDRLMELVGQSGD